MATCLFLTRLCYLRTRVSSALSRKEHSFQKLPAKLCLLCFQSYSMTQSYFLNPEQHVRASNPSVAPLFCVWFSCFLLLRFFCYVSRFGMFPRVFSLSVSPDLGFQISLHLDVLHFSVYHFALIVFSVSTIVHVSILSTFHAAPPATAKSLIFGHSIFCLFTVEVLTTFIGPCLCCVPFV